MLLRLKPKKDTDIITHIVATRHTHGNSRDA